MLQHLVRMHDIEAVAGEAQRMHVLDREVEVVQTSARREIARQRERVLIDLGRRHVGDDPGEVDRDAAWPCSDVEKPGGLGQVRAEVLRGVGDVAAAVRAEDGLMVPVRVGGHASVWQEPLA